MIFISWIIGYLIALSLYVGIRSFFRYLKKERIFQNLELKDDGINGSVSLLISFLFAFVMFFLFKHVTLFNMSLLFFCLNLTILFIQPTRVAKSFKEKNIKSKTNVISAIAILYFIVEIFVFNYKSYPNNLTPKTYNLNDSTIVEKLVVSENEDSTYSINSNNIIDLNMPENAEYISFDATENNKTETIYVYFQIQDEGTELFYNSFYNVKTYTINPTVDMSLRLYVPSTCRGRLVRIKFVINYNSYKAQVPFELKSFTINSYRNFSFSFIRYALVSFLILFFVNISYFYKKKETSIFSRFPKFQKLSPYKKRYIVVGISTFVCLVSFIIIAFCKQDMFFRTVDYVVDNVEQTSTIDIYSDLFYSILNGRVYLTIEPDITVIEGEAQGLNVWSHSVRSQYGINAAWDHAYYNGHYYSYYGVLPVFLFYFPAYLLSGFKLIPTPLYGLGIATILIVASFYLLLLEIDRHISKGNTNFQRLFIVFLCSFFLIMTINNFCLKDGGAHEGIYHLPIATALVEQTLFLLFAFRAYRKKDKRMINMFFSGLFYACLFLTRPNQCLSIIFACPLFIAMLFDKGISFKKRILSFIPLFSILIIGFSLMAVYNYVRYDNFLEFGQSYQMNSDQLSDTYKVNTYQIEKFIPSMYHFMFEEPNFYTTFPYISCSVRRLSFDICSYIQGSYGVFLIPAFIFMLASPFLFNGKGNGVYCFFFSLVPIFVILFVFTTYSKAGICARYLIENFYFSSIGSLGVFLYLMNKHKEEKHTYKLQGLLFVVLFTSAFICFNLSYDSFDGHTVGDMGGILIKIKEAFTPFYY